MKRRSMVLVAAVLLMMGGATFLSGLPTGASPARLLAASLGSANPKTCKKGYKLVHGKCAKVHYGPFTAKIVTDAKTVGRYAPGTIMVHVGQKVTFTNRSDAVHTVTDSKSNFDSGDIQTGASWSFTPKKAGRFTFYCKYHPLMHGLLIVKA
jgi:plastocyanin